MVSLPSQTDFDGDTAARKRRRIALACEECRDRKRKCDGERPVCGACARRPGQICIWNDDRNTKGWSNNYVESLRSRVRELEEALGSSHAHPPSEDRSGLLGQTLPLSYAQSCTRNTGLASSQDSDHLMHWNPEIALPSDISPTDPVRHSGPLNNSSFGTAHQDSHNGIPSPARSRSTPDHQSIGAQDGTFDAMCLDRCETEVDGMGVISSSVPGTSPQLRRPSEYFGPSSTFGLLDEARDAISQKLYGRRSRMAGSRQSESSVRTAHSHNASRAHDRTSISDFVPFGLYSVPPRAEADSLVDSYRSWVHSLYPFVHLPSFHQRYLHLWDAAYEEQTDTSSRSNDDYYDTVGDKLFYCLLNVVFSLGALFNSDIASQERHSVSSTFFDRAKKVLDFDLLSHGSAPLVQTLLLMGQYLQSTDVPSSCWNTIGLAIRVAQGIGLQFEPWCCRKESCPNGHDQLEIEMRRRTWTGAVLFDRILSLTYGRPLMVYPTNSKTQFVLPSAIDDEFLSRDPKNPGHQISGRTSLVECYVQAVKLQDILGQVLASFYSRGMDEGDDFDENDEETTKKAQRANRVGDSDLHMLLSVDELLDIWVKNLPVHLRAQPRSAEFSQDSSTSFSNKQDRVRTRQSTVLRARFLHVRLTLLRPVLLTLCDQSHTTINLEEGSSVQTTMRDEMMIKSANLCVSAAQELVEIIVGSMDLTSSIEKLPQPWYNVFYIHSSAIVLLMGYICWPKHITGITRDSLIADFNRCISFFQAYESYSSSASRCGKVLEVMQQQVFGHQNGSATGNREEFMGNKDPIWGNQIGTLESDFMFLAPHLQLTSSDGVLPPLSLDEIDLNNMGQGWLG